MKNVKKLLISVFALSALMLGACSGSQQTSSSTPASSSSTQPTTTSTEPTPASSDAEDSSAEEESSVEESSSEEGPIEHAVTLNEAPTAGRVVVVHGWNDLGGVFDIHAEVEGGVVKFTLMPDDDLTGYLIAELKEGKTFDDFSFFDPEDATKIEHDWTVVARQTNNITDLSATEASWQSVAPTSEFDAELDASATTAYAGRTFFVCSWKEGYVNAYDYFTAAGKVKIATAADGFLVAVLKEGKTADDGVGADWANVEEASKSVDVTTMPEEKITISASGAKLVVALDGAEPTTENIVQVWSKINIADADLDKPAYAWIFTNDTDGVWYEATHIAETWETASNRHYSVNVGSVDPTGKKIVFAVFSSVTGDTPDWANRIVQSSDGTIAYSGGSFWVDANVSAA